MPLPQELHSKIVEFLLSLPNMHDSRTQQALIFSAGLDIQLQNQIAVGGSPDQFVRLLIATLLDYGKLEDGRHALEAVLEATKNSVGLDKRNDCDTLIQEFREVRQSWPALVKLVLEADLAECNETRSQDVVHILASILTIEKDSIHILQMKPGGRDIIFELPTSSAMELVTLFQTHSEKLVQLEQQSLVKEVILLSTEHGPRFAVCQWERQQRANLDILDRTVPLEKHYQVLPLLREVKKERLPHELRKRKLKEWDEGAMLEMEEEARYMMSDMEEGIRDKLRPMDILRWEEELREEQVTYEKVTLEQVFKDFRSVAKEAKSAVPRFVVLGPPGSGKTTLVQYLAWQAANRKLSASSRNLIPARLRLREWEAWAVKPLDPENSLPEYLAERYKDLTPTPTTEQWRGWLQQGDVLLLLDGLDEISGNQSFLTALKTALDTFKDCPMILTCRTVSFDQHQNLCPNFPVFTLAGLDNDQCNAYVHAFSAEYPDRFNPDALTEQLKRTPQMFPLAANPLLLSIICYVVDDPRGVMLPARRGELYTKAVEKLLTRPRRQEVTYPGGKTDLPLTRKRRILEHVAFRLFVGMEQQRHLTFDEDSLLDALTRGVKAEELANPADIADTLLTDLTKNSGILRGDAEQGYFFLHLTIQEFLTAGYLARLVNDKKKGWKAKVEIGDKTWMMSKLVDRKAWDPDWQEVITLFAGQLNDPAPLLGMLSRSFPTLMNPQGDDLFRHRLALAALCLPELPSTIRNSQSQIIDHITTAAFSFWWEHCINKTLDAVPHLTRALPALGQVNGRFRGKNQQNIVPLLEWLTDQLHDKNSDMQWAATEAVKGIGSVAATPEFLACLIEMLRDPNEDVWKVATFAVGGLGSAATKPEVLDCLVELLHNPERDVQYAAAMAVRDIGSAAAKPEILDCLADLLRNDYVQDATERAVNDLECLVALLQDDYIQNAVAKTIKGIRSGELDSDYNAKRLEYFDKLISLGYLNEEVRETLARTGEGHFRKFALLNHLNALLTDDYVQEVSVRMVRSDLRSFMARLDFSTLLPNEDVQEMKAEVDKNIGKNLTITEILARLEKLFYDVLFYDVQNAAVETVKALGSAAATSEILVSLANLLRNPDWFVQMNAVAAVRALGHAAAKSEIIDSLVGLLRNTNFLVLMDAVKILKSFEPTIVATPENLARLADLLHDTNYFVRLMVIDLARNFGSAAAKTGFLARLVGLLQNPDANIRWTAVQVVNGLGSAAATPEFLSCLIELLRDGDKDVRVAALGVVSNLGRATITPIILTYLARLLRDPDREVRLAALWTIWDLGSIAATPEIFAGIGELLHDPEGEFQAVALGALWSIGNTVDTTEFLAYLAELSHDPNASVREAVAETATRAIEDIGDKVITEEFLATLADLLCDEDKGVRVATVKVVEVLGSAAAKPQIIACLSDLLRDTEWDVRRAALEVVEILGNTAATTEILDCLAKLLSNPEQESWLWTAAKDAVKSIGETAATSEILDSLADLLHDPSDYLRQATIEVVESIGSVAAKPEFLNRLVKLLHDEDKDVRMATARAVFVLGRTAGTQAILNCLADMLRDPEREVRGVAVAAMGKIGVTTTEFLDCLAELLHDEDQNVREMAVEVVKSLGSAAAKPEFLVHLAALLRNRDENVREATAKALANMMAQNVWIFERQDGKYEGRTVAELSALD